MLRTALTLLAACAALFAAAALAPAQEPAGLAYSIELPGTIDPATEGWIDQALEEAEEKGAEIAIIRIDTPGGLDSSTREIVQDIIAAPMPVVTYVSPDGARAASAGLFITEAGDVAAMAPQTNIGSATPISIGPGETDEVLGRKIENDAAAYVRALAEGHGRNPDLAEEMVRDARNVTASVALEEDLIDLVASDQQQLLERLDGFRVEGPKAQTLDTENLTIENRDMPLQFDLLQILVNPNIAFLLLLVGLLGIGFEVFNPGTIVPGAFGAVAFLLGLYGTAQLPIALAGILLLLLAVGLIIAEIHLPTGGVLGIAGVLALAASGLLLYDTDSDAVGISPPVIIALTIAIAGAGAFVIQRVMAARERPVMTGWEELIGAEASVRAPLDPVGQVFVEGTRWRARPAAEGESIGVGDRVRVEAVDGLTLIVSREEVGEEEMASEAEGAE